MEELMKICANLPKRWTKSLEKEPKVEEPRLEAKFTHCILEFNAYIKSMGVGERDQLNCSQLNCFTDMHRAVGLCNRQIWQHQLEVTQQ